MMDAFGVVAMIAMVPLITIQVLGLLFRRREMEAERERMQRNVKEVDPG